MSASGLDGCHELFNWAESQASYSPMDIADGAIGIDDEHTATRESERTHRSVQGSNGLIGICKERKTESVLVGKYLVASNILRRDSENLSPNIRESRQLVVV
jgi:hypothetical protein